MTTLSIATWNINSVRLRIGLVERFLASEAPDILCLQETKTPDANFPSGPLRALGYHAIEIAGQKGYHGVAIVARVPIALVEKRLFCGKNDCRHVAVDVSLGEMQARLHNFYVPSGGDIPDVEANPKFAHKLAFLDEMRNWLGSEAQPTILVGDLNVAPYENDVWSHRQMRRVVSHTPVECERLEAARKAGGLVDIMRRFVPRDEKLYTWWSYRARDWQASNRGRRLDHVWTSADIAPYVVALKVLSEARGWAQPSDHVPVIARFAL